MRRDKRIAHWVVSVADASVILTQRTAFGVLTAIGVVRCLHPERGVAKQARVDNVLLDDKNLGDDAVDDFCKVAHAV